MRCEECELSWGGGCKGWGTDGRIGAASSAAARVRELAAGCGRSWRPAWSYHHAMPLGRRAGRGGGVDVRMQAWGLRGVKVLPAPKHQSPHPNALMPASCVEFIKQ